MESKSLRIIQVIVKIARVISIIGLICCSIATVALVASAVFAFVFPFADYELDGVNLLEYIEQQAGGITMKEIGAMCVVSAISMLAMTVTIKIEHTYYDKELEQGTPFTIDGANYLKKVAFICILITIGAAIAGLITFKIFQNNGFISQKYEFESTLEIAWFLFLLFLSVVFKCGAEQQQVRG